ncbi:MAG: FAD-dependent monooxygenase [Terrimicrobiaceae bacterium]
MSDLLIVGAGPVGLTMALACRQFGVSFRLVEKLPAPSGLSKALAVWSAAQETLDVLGVADEFLRRSIHGKGVRISRGKRPLIEVPAGFGLDTPFPEMLLLPQSESEAILGEKLETAGVAVERGTELVSLVQSATGVEAGLRRAGSGVTPETFRWVAACDGAHSTVRHLVGAEFEGTALGDLFVLCDAEIEGKIDAGFVHIFWPSQGLLAIFPVRKNVWRIIATREPGSPEAEPSLSEIQSLLDHRGPGGWVLGNPTWLSKFRVSERKAARYRHGRVFLAGDAAHIHSPAGGQGMNTGMQDAFNLAWKFAFVSAGHGREDIVLDSYHAERSPVAEKVLRESGRMIRSNSLKNPLAQIVRDRIVRLAGHSKAVKKSVVRTLSGLDISYGPGNLVSDDRHWHEDWRPHGFAPGSRPREASVFREGKKISLFREMRSPLFTLVLFSGRKPIYRDVDRLGSVRLVAAGYGGLVRTISIWHGENPPAADWLLDPDVSAHKRFGVEQPSFYLVRPDQYVALRSQPAEAVVLHEWLAGITDG